MRFAGTLREIRGMDGLMHLAGACRVAIEPGSRLLIVPTTRPTSGDADYLVYASAGPPDSPAAPLAPFPVTLGVLHEQST